jgi:hypothetical protein
MKQRKRKYGFQKCHIKDWDLHLLWLTMGYRFNQQASLASFSPYFLLFSCHPELPTSIRCDVMVVVSLDDPLMWL